MKKILDKESQPLKDSGKKMNVKFRYYTIFVSFSILLIAVCSFSSTKVILGNTPVKSDDHPRLIITGRNLGDFVRKSRTTHKNLYDLALRLADDFSKREPPKPKNAGNSYREIGETMPSLGLAYLMTKDKKYLSAAEKWITVLLDVPTWNGSQNLGRSAWVTGIGQLYDWLYHDLNDDLKERIIIRLKSEAEIIKNTAAKTRALSNHLLIETSALGTVGLILPEGDPQRDTYLTQATQWTEYIIRNAPLDGSWGEGVQYWEYGLGYFLRYLEGASTAGYRDFFQNYDWLKKTGRFPLHFSVPDNLTRVVNFSDCGSDRYIPAFLLYLPAGKYKDHVSQDYAIKIQATEPHKFSWLDFLTYDSSLKPVDYRTVENEFYHFEDNGFVTMRSSWKEDATLVGFRCGAAPGHANQAKPERLKNEGYGPGHQHPDINTFVIYSNGTWLAMDPGYVYLKETRNYNTILVNEKGQAGAGEQWLDFMKFEAREPAPKITLAETTPGFDYIIGNAGNIYVDEAGLEYFERQLMFVKPDMVIIADRLKCKANSTFQWLLHANSNADIKEMQNGYDINKMKASLSVFPLLPRDVKSDVTERNLRGSDVRGEPGSHETEGMLKAINLYSTGTETNFLNVLTINKPGEGRPLVSMKDNQIRIVKNGREYNIIFKPDKLLSEKVLELK